MQDEIFRYLKKLRKLSFAISSSVDAEHKSITFGACIFHAAENRSFWKFIIHFTEAGVNIFCCDKKLLGVN